jgi:REP element-mobilizing transposase RayT
MANTYTQIRIHLVFAVKGRQNLIPKRHRESVEKYITGIVQNRKHKLLAIYCMPDHIHILVGFHPADSISNLTAAIKKASLAFVREQVWMPFLFDWQRGFGAFSYAKSQTEAVISYILNQEEHHRKKSFREEYLDMLEKFEVEFKEEYLFEFYD